MVVALVAFVGLFLIVLAAALVLFGGYRLRDLFLIAFLTSAAFYLSRFDAHFSATVMGRPYAGFLFYLLSMAFVLTPVRMLFREAPSLRLSMPVLMFLGFGVLSLTSGLLNRGFAGVGAAVQVLVITFAPPVVALLWVDLMPRDRATHHRLLLSFILLVGLLTPAVFIVTSVAPDAFGSVLGWSGVTVARSAGFVRGWSPLGGAIATGVLMVIAYGLAMHEVVGRRRRRYIAVLVLTAVAVLFTLSRSVLLMFILFHVVYFWSAIRRQPLRIFGLGLVGLVLMTPILIELRERYSFERFTRTQDESTSIRASSAVAAIEAAFERPFFGHGPGLLYEQIRMEGVVAGTAQTRAMYVGGRVSALEPHNLYLLLAAEHGIPAMILFVAGMILIWRRSRMMHSEGSDEDASMNSAVRAIWIACLFMFLTYSGPLVNPQASLFFWFFAMTGLHWQAMVTAEAALPYAVAVPGGALPALPRWRTVATP